MAEQFLRRHPTPTSTSALKNMLKLIYTYHTPSTNSSSSKDIYYPYQSIPAATLLHSNQFVLSFDEKENKLNLNNGFDSISTKEVHQKVMQDALFGSANFNRNKDKWIYIAKK
jgi:hypothetical protein